MSLRSATRAPGSLSSGGGQQTGSSSRWDILCHKYCVNCTAYNRTCLLVLRFPVTLTADLQVQTYIAVNDLEAARALSETRRQC